MGGKADMDHRCSPNSIYEYTAWLGGEPPASPATGCSLPVTPFSLAAYAALAFLLVALLVL